MINKLMLFLCLYVLGAGMVFAQDIELFRFTNANIVEGNEMVLYHNTSDNSIKLIKKSSSNLNEKDGYLQSFILKRLERGNILIASAKQKNHFLKFSNTSNDVVFSTIENSNELDNYTWRIQFAGQGKILISPLNNLNKGLVQKEGNIIKLEEFKDGNNQELTTGKIVGDQYRFTMEKIANVL